jgi:hypothetical protein
LQAVRSELHERLFDWARHRKTRITMSDADIEKRADTARGRGIIIGEW